MILRGGGSRRRSSAWRGSWSWPRGAKKAASLPARVRRRVVVLEPPRIEISSTEIRGRLRRGLTVRYWTPDTVLRYMSRHGLYGNRDRS